MRDEQDQGQYWSKAEPHEFQPVAYFANAYKESSTGKRMAADVDGPPVRKPAVDPLQRTKYVPLCSCRQPQLYSKVKVLENWRAPF